VAVFNITRSLPHARLKRRFVPLPLGQLASLLLEPKKLTAPIFQPIAGWGAFAWCLDSTNGENTRYGAQSSGAANADISGSVDSYHSDRASFIGSEHVQSAVTTAGGGQGGSSLTIEASHSVGVTGSASVIVMCSPSPSSSTYSSDANGNHVPATWNLADSDNPQGLRIDFALEEVAL